MELKLNSWYVWLWNYTYAHKMPNNLCPFFWQLVVAILLFIPNVIFRIPTQIFNAFSQNPIERGDARTGFGVVGYILLIGSIFTLSSIYNWIRWATNSHSYNSVLAAAGGLFLLIGLFLVIREIWLRNDTGYKIIETTNNNIVTTYFKAWYKNHCPKINWK